MTDRYTSAEVIGLTGISARQLQWWDERKVVVPAREGHRRLYSLDDVTEIAVICDLRTARLLSAAGSQSHTPLTA